MTDKILMMEPRTTIRETAVQAANIKSVLVHIQNDANVRQRLQLALSLGRTTGAHLQCVQVTPIEAYVAMGTFGGVFAMDKWIKTVDAQEERLRSELEEQLRIEDVSWDYEQVTGYATPELINRASLADLVITGRTAHSARSQRPELAVLGDLLTHMRTPMLIPGTIEQQFDPFGVAIVAWNGSLEAANAVRSALALLGLASETRIIRYAEARATSFQDIRLTEYLSRHGIHAELDVRAVSKDFSADLVQYALAYEASYIVMGGYSHSRAGEFLFGGVTRDLLRECPLPVVMAH